MEIREVRVAVHIVVATGNIQLKSFIASELKTYSPVGRHRQRHVRTRMLGGHWRMFMKEEADLHLSSRESRYRLILLLGDTE